MPLNFNSVNIPANGIVNFNGQSNDKVVQGGVEVWKRRIYLYRNGVTGEVDTGPWIGIGAPIHPNPTSNVIQSPYGTIPSGFSDTAGKLYVEGHTTCCGGMRTSKWIPWTNFVGMTCHCKGMLYANPWGYADDKYNRKIPYIDGALWTSNYSAVGNVINARSSPFAGYQGVPPVDVSGATFDGYVNKNKLYQWNLDLSFKCPSTNGWLFFTLARGVPSYSYFSTYEIYIE